MPSLLAASRGWLAAEAVAVVLGGLIEPGHHHAMRRRPGFSGQGPPRPAHRTLHFSAAPAARKRGYDGRFAATQRKVLIRVTHRSAGLRDGPTRGHNHWRRPRRLPSAYPATPRTALPVSQAGLRGGGAASGPPDGHLADPLLLRDRPVIQGAQLGQGDVRPDFDRLPGPLRQQAAGHQAAHRILQRVVMALLPRQLDQQVPTGDMRTVTALVPRQLSGNCWPRLQGFTRRGWLAGCGCGRFWCRRGCGRWWCRRGAGRRSSPTGE